MSKDNQAKRQPALERVRELAANGVARAQIIEVVSNEHGVTPSSLRRWIAAEGIEVASTYYSDAFKAEVMQALQDGCSNVEASARFGVSENTIIRWAQAVGVKGTYKMKGAPPVKRERNIEQVLALHAQGLSIFQIAEALPEKINPDTISDWLRQRGLTAHYVPVAGNKQPGAQPHPQRDAAKVLYYQGVLPKEIGEQLGVSSATVSYWASYHGWARELGRTRGDNVRKRRPNPSNYQTWTCKNPRCPLPDGKFERLKSAGVKKFCSNSCATKCNKKAEIVVPDTGDVLDSLSEATFMKWCQINKIEVERFDREHVVEFDGHRYGPDFWLPTLKLAVEVKGFERPGDAAKWAAFRTAGHKLAVVFDEDLFGLTVERLTEATIAS